MVAIPFSSRSEVYDLSAGDTGPLDFPFPLLATTDLIVTRRRSGVDTTLTLGTDYTVTLAAASATVTLTAPAVAGDAIVVLGLRPPARSTAFVANGPFRSSDANGELERQTIFNQEARRDIDRAVLRHPADTATGDLSLPIGSGYLYRHADGSLGLGQADSDVAGPGLSGYTWTASAAPSPPATLSQGRIQPNHAAAMSVTELYVSAQNASGANYADVIAYFGQGTTPSHRGILQLVKAGDPTVQLTYRVTGAPTLVAGSPGYYRLPVAFVGSSGSLAGNTPIAVPYARTGDGIPADGAFDVVATIADLKDMPTGGVGTVRVLGYYAATDGVGTRTYRWDALSTDTDDGGSIIEPTAGGTGRWKLVHGKVLDVRWFGAKGDGNVATDDTAAIRAAVAALPARGKLLIPDTGAHYRLATVTSYKMITLSQAMRLKLDGELRSAVDATATVHHILSIEADDIRIDGRGTLRGQGAFLIANLAPTVSTSPSLLRVAGPNWAGRFKNVRVRGITFHDPHYMAVLASFCSNLTLDRCDVVGGPHTGVTSVSSDIVYGFELDVCENTQIIDCKFRANAAGGAVVICINGSHYASAEGHGLTVSRCEAADVWDKFVYTQYPECVITQNRYVGRTGYGNFARVGARSVVAQNIATNLANGALAGVLSSHLKVVDNIFRLYGNTGFALYNDYQASADVTDVLVKGNTFVGDTSLDDVGPAIFLDATTSTDPLSPAFPPWEISNANICDNVLLDCDTKQAGGPTDNRGAIRIYTSNGAAGYRNRQITIARNKIERCGRSGILAFETADLVCEDNEIVDAGQQGATDGIGLYLGLRNEHFTARRNRFRETRSGGSRVFARGYYDTGATLTGGVFEDNEADNLINAVPWTMAAPASRRIGGNRVRGVPLRGNFTATAGATSVIANQNAWTTAASVRLLPTNAAAANLAAGGGIWMDKAATVAGTSFTLKPGTGVFAGTETFDYELVA